MEIKDIIQKYKDVLYGKNMVLQLSQDGVSDYERGRIYGNIEMLTQIEMELDRDDEDSTL